MNSRVCGVSFCPEDLKLPGAITAGLLPFKHEDVRLIPAFCKECGVDPSAIQKAEGFDRERLKEDAVAQLRAM